MRKILLSLLCLLTIDMVARQVLQVSTTDGTPFYTVPEPEGVAHIYVFSDLNHAVLTTQDGGMADWYRLPAGTQEAAGYTAFTRAQNGGTYRVVENGVADTFTVFDYSLYRLDRAELQWTVQPTCDGTFLSTSDIENMVYDAPLGGHQTLERVLHVSYDALVGDSAGNGWHDMTREKEIIVDDWTAVSLGEPLYKTTRITLCDTTIAAVLYGQNDCVQTEEISPIAVNYLPTSATTTRGLKVENEIDRPIQESQLKGSAPLNVLFKSNATPETTAYTRWEIMYSSDVLSVRTEPETRYEFIDAGAYTVRLTIGNDYCTKDTTFSVNVSESMLAVPNVFTPNGDGVNDEFRVAYRSLREFHIWVYDRWGHQVYASDDPAKGWNGMIGSRPAAEGAYYYVIRALGTDAPDESSYMAKMRYKKKFKETPDDVLGIYQMSGAVNLLRGKK